MYSIFVVPLLLSVRRVYHVMPILCIRGQIQTLCMTFSCNLSACLLQGSFVRLTEMGRNPYSYVRGVNSSRADVRAVM